MYKIKEHIHVLQSYIIPSPKERGKDNGMITTDTNMVLLYVLYNAQQ